MTCQVTRRIHHDQRNTADSASYTTAITSTPTNNNGDSNDCKSGWKRTGPTGPTATTGPLATTGTTSCSWRWWRWWWRWWRWTSTCCRRHSPPTSSSPPSRIEWCLERQHANDLHWRKRHSQDLPPNIQLLQKCQSLQ